MAWDNAMRLIDVAVALVCVALLLRKARLFWSQYHSRTKDFWWVLMSWCLAIILGILEVLLGWDTSYRVIFTLMALLLTLKVLLRPNEVEHPTFSTEL